MSIVINKPEINITPLRAKINELLYSLQMDAKRCEQLERLIIERDEEIAEAYDFSYGCTRWDEETSIRNDTEYLVIEIIALKDRYAKKIKKCKIRHEKFKELLDRLPSEESEVLAKALCTDLEVDEKIVKAVIKKHLKIIQSYYPED